MTTLWLDRKDMELRADGGAVVPYAAGRRGRPVPLRLLERIVIMGNCALDAALLGLLAENGVSLAVLSPRKSRRRAWLMGPGHGDAALRLKHLAAASDAAFRAAEASRLIRAKVRRQRRATARMLRERPDAAYFLNRALRTMREVSAALESSTLAPDVLRGLEGAAANAGFSALAAILPPALGFSGRRRRPPPDPANAALSLAYTILHHRAAQVAWAHGLDPLLGFFHEPAHGRESLAADLMEPWRPEVELWTWRMFATRALRPDHFRMTATPEGAESCMLGKAGRRIFYQELEDLLAPLMRALRLQTRALVRRIREREQ